MYLPLVSGGLLPLDFDSDKQLINELISDDFGAPPKCLVIECTTKDNKTVTISIPYSDNNEVVVNIE
ncbi:MAG: hypothetical protein Q7J16_12160 [Candidatus Cloacimonadales bacterium]|nr:hypothetical protein [Candidatus Cloacimonadales bacterium]